MTNIYDYITADQDLAKGDQIFYNNDYIEVTSSYTEGDTVVVKGNSYNTGDSVTYFIPIDAEVGLWSA